MIKQKLITGKVDILCIGGLPEDAKITLPNNVTFNGEQGSLIYKGKDGNPVFIPLPPGKWQPIGFLKDIPEDLAKEIVDDCPYYAKCWKKYNICPELDYGDCPEAGFDKDYRNYPLIGFD